MTLPQVMRDIHTSPRPTTAERLVGVLDVAKAGLTHAKWLRTCSPDRNSYTDGRASECCVSAFQSIIEKLTAIAADERLRADSSGSN